MPADTVAVAKEVLQHLNTWSSKPCVFCIEELKNTSPALMMQPLSGSGIQRKYVDGSFVGIFTFAVYYRTSMTDTHAKVSAYELLESLAYWLENSSLPAMGGKRIAISIEQTATTALAQVDEVNEDYQTIFSLQYKQGI